jgi:hypothetical protein
VGKEGAEERGKRSRKGGSRREMTGSGKGGSRIEMEEE